MFFFYIDYWISALLFVSHKNSPYFFFYFALKKPLFFTKSGFQASLIWCKSMLNMMLITTKMSSEKYINSTYTLSESILRLDFINSNTYFMLNFSALLFVSHKNSPYFFLRIFPKKALIFHKIWLSSGSLFS
jgi:hypothetical protein